MDWIKRKILTGKPHIFNGKIYGCPIFNGKITLVSCIFFSLNQSIDVHADAVLMTLLSTSVQAWTGKIGRRDVEELIQINLRIWDDLPERLNTIYGFVWKCGVNIPNEIAIFHRDNDQQNHWVFWGTRHFQTKPFVGWWYVTPGVCWSHHLHSASSTWNWRKSIACFDRGGEPRRRTSRHP